MKLVALVFSVLVGLNTFLFADPVILDGAYQLNLVETNWEKDSYGHGTQPANRINATVFVNNGKIRFVPTAQKYGREVLVFPEVDFRPNAGRFSALILASNPTRITRTYREVTIRNGREVAGDAWGTSTINGREAALFSVDFTNANNPELTMNLRNAVNTTRYLTEIDGLTARPWSWIESTYNATWRGTRLQR